MTELAVPTEQEDQSYGPPSSLVAWADGARAAHVIAISLAATPFVPKQMQGHPELVTAAILAGHEMGLQPLAALRSIDLINGVPAMRAHAMRGLVQSRGHAVWVIEQTDVKAVVCGRRLGHEEVQRSTWTMARARLMGLDQKPTYKSMPAAMLVARATSEVCRLIASDVLLGIPYSTEELEDLPAADEVPAPRRAARRAVAIAEPALAEPGSDVDPLANVVVPFAEPEPELEP